MYYILALICIHRAATWHIRFTHDMHPHAGVRPSLTEYLSTCWCLLSPDPGCLAFPVTLTVLAIQRVFGHHEHLCPFWMHHALCNWPRLHGGSAGPLPELPISEAWASCRVGKCWEVPRFGAGCIFRGI